MFQRLLYFILLVTYCSSCCDENKGCCGSKPPNPELFPEARSWVSFYKDKKYIVVQNQLSQKDTLLVQFEKGTEYCGGDECGAQCEIEIVLLKSKSDPSIELSIEAINNRIIINPDWNSQLNSNHKFAVFISLDAGSTSTDPEFIKSELLPNYQFKGEALTVIKAKCNDPVKCQNFKMPSITVSKERGLIEFEDYRGNRWIVNN